MNERYLTPDKRIEALRTQYPEYHHINSSDIMDYFTSHKDYREARDIYWTYFNHFYKSGIHPLSPKVPPVPTEKEELWRTFHNLINKKFAIPYGN